MYDKGSPDTIILQLFNNMPNTPMYCSFIQISIHSIIPR